MSRKHRKPFILALTAILVVITVIISIIWYRSWLSDPKGMVGMMAAVIVGAVGITAFIYTLLQDIPEKPIEKLTREQQHSVREHLKAGLLYTQKNMLNGFLDEYLGRDEAVPFGGRDAELAELDRWLNDPKGSSYLLLTAPAGRGKTHLLVQWASKLIAQPKKTIRVIFVPVSIRFGTAQPEIYLQMLARGLSQFYEDRIQENIGDTRAVWREICAEYLSKKDKPGKGTLLVVMDGLDESTDPDLDHWRILIGELPSDTRVLFSARWLGEEKDKSGWQTRLGLDDARSTHLTLSSLDTFGLQQVLESMGNPLKWYAQEKAIQKELLRLTEGDPLLVRLYVHDLQEKLKPEQQNGKMVDAKNVWERLKASEPDLKGYFNGWWQDQRKQWKAKGENVYEIEDKLRGFLVLLSAAFAPLKGEEIADLLGGDFRYSWKQERVAELAPRIIIGAGKSGYTLSHSRFGLYFYEEMDDMERIAKEESFLAAGRRILDALRDGLTTPGETHGYFVFHTKDHLLRALKDGRAKPQNLYDLLCEEWLRAHEYHSGTPDSFLEDVEAAWEIASRQANGNPDVQMLSALCFTSVSSLSSNIPDNVVSQAYRVGIVNRAQALCYIRQNRDLGSRTVELMQLAEMEKVKDERESLLQEALEAAFHIKESFWRDIKLAEIAPYLPIDQAIKIALQIQSLDSRVRALAKTAPYLPNEEQTLVLNAAIDIACQISDPFLRADLIADIAPYIPPEKQLNILRKALDLTYQIKDGRHRSITMAKIASYLPHDQQSDTLGEALKIARQIKKYSPRNKVTTKDFTLESKEQSLQAIREEIASDSFARALTEIAQYFPIEKRTGILHEVLDFIQQNRIPQLDMLLRDIASLLPVEEGLIIARKIKVKSYQATALVSIAPYLPHEQQMDIIREALETSRQIKDTSTRTWSLAQIIPNLPTDYALEIAQKLEPSSSSRNGVYSIPPALLSKTPLEYVDNIESSCSIAWALAKIASHMPPGQQSPVLQEAYKVVCQIQDSVSLASVLAEIAQYMSPIKILDLVQKIQGAQTRVWAMVMITPYLSPKQKARILNEALDHASRFGDYYSRAWSMADIAPELPLNKALEVANKIENPYSQVRALINIALHLPTIQRPGLFQEALQIASNIEERSSRDSAIAEVAPHLPLVEALEIARNIKDYSSQNKAFAEIACQLEPDEALDLISKIKDSSSRNKALAKIAYNIPSKYLPFLWEEGLKQPSNDLIWVLSRRWEELCLAAEMSLQDAFTRTLRTYQTSKRSDCFILIAAMEPVIVKLGGQESLMKTVEAIQLVNKWWP